MQEELSFQYQTIRQTFRELHGPLLSPDIQTFISALSEAECALQSSCPLLWSFKGECTIKIDVECTGD